MKKLFLIICALMLTAPGFAKFVPDEGMWLPMFIEGRSYQEMKEKGLKLSPKEIYDINNSSLKDAIVNFGNFCTAEVVSHQGLLFTNHHCGYSAIQEHSSVEHDYLTEGFWAQSKNEELPNEDLTASFFVRMEDVTDSVLQDVTWNMPEKERSKKIAEATKKIEKKAEEDGKYVTSVESFYRGNEYYLFVYKVYKDVRLVGAPPESIGNYGGDTDNWMWPRHTGDFSIFRIYADEKGNPAAYSEDNVPLETDYALPLSLEDRNKHDFAMIWGYPGRTDRYRTSYGIQATLNSINPAIHKMGRNILDALERNMNRSEEVRIMYSSKEAQISNMWKNKKGESRSLKNLDILEKKRNLENELMEWIRKKPEREEKYGNLKKDFRSAYDSLQKKMYFTKRWNYGLATFGSSLMQFTLQNMGIGNIAKSDKSQEEKIEDLKKYKTKAKEHFKNYDIQTEKDVLKASLKTIYNSIPLSQLPPVYKTIIADYDQSFDAYVDALFEESIFATKEKFMEFLEDPDADDFEEDMAVTAAKGLQSKLMELRMNFSQTQRQLKRTKRQFIHALRRMKPNKDFYPDANGTMRLTYGEVLDYYPRDGVHYEYYTTLEGVMQKKDMDDPEFVVPKKLQQLYNEKDYGRYANKKEGMTVCFLTNNDITGGNSGSPVINGKGQMTGIAFDGNWEAMSGDIAFEPELQRTICVDIRYVLFVIDKFADADHLLSELNIIEKKHPLPPVEKEAKKEMKKEQEQ
ncbi:MAG: S46 family peptidase [Bacteroidales bacterium]|nr:S46 family peptidase [Bacteroidales bacterium]MCF8334490.1 S46 family peptidase [Bacteroidales bacterium]